ncbi:jg1487, partial [Pararge aegeria aegeria]
SPCGVLCEREHFQRKTAIVFYKEPTFKFTH